ncbi:MAG: hypothetical protein IKO10_13135 [Lachnospiraceae bacterium]|nr:hypothetical protein [Lachnospiraceae bacterium]
METFMLLDAGLGNLVVFGGGLAFAGFLIGGIVLVIKSVKVIRQEIKKTSEEISDEAQEAENDGE